MKGRLRIFGLSHVYRDRKGRGSLPALSEINLELEPGQFLAVIGPSGCGKSTLLNLIAGFSPVQEGEILEDGSPVREPGSSRVLLSQEQSLFGWKTGLGNVVFGLKARGLPREEQVSRARHYLEMVGLADFAEHYPHHLSGGMKQRLALARALAVEPNILLLDEPFGALDGQSRQELQDQLLRLRPRLRHTVVMVTHDIEEAIYLADGVVVMTPRPGRVLERLPIDLPRPRLPEHRLLATFVEYRQHLWRKLRSTATSEGKT